MSQVPENNGRSERIRTSDPLVPNNCSVEQKPVESGENENVLSQSSAFVRANLCGSCAENEAGPAQKQTPEAGCATSGVDVGACEKANDGSEYASHLAELQAEQETFARGYVDRIVAVTRRAAETLADRWFLYDSEIPAGATNGARELLWMSFLQGVRDGVILICQDRPGLSESSRAALTKIALDAACDRAMRLNAAPATGGRA